MSTFSELLLEVRRGVDDRLALIWSRELEHWRGQGRAVSEPLEAAKALSLRGGKRFRAALVAVGYQAASACEGGARAPGVRSVADWAAVLEVCSAVELLQAYFLIHDDWMDQDAVRRGGPAVHAALAESWGGSHLGACGGVLAGDYSVALASQTLAGSALPPELSAPAALRFSQMRSIPSRMPRKFTGSKRAATPWWGRYNWVLFWERLRAPGSSLPKSSARGWG